MTTTSIGYDGTVNEQQFASLFGAVGAAYGVLGATDLQVLVGSGGAGSITVKAGSAFGKGVLDTFSTDNTSLAAAAVSSGTTRWDTVVVTRNWSGTGGTTTIAINPGSATKQITRTNTTPGTIDDQPIALIRSVAGLTAVQEIVDLRTWPHKMHHAASAAAIPFMTHLPGLGSRFYAADSGHEFVIGSGGLVDLDNPNFTAFPIVSGLAADDTAPLYGKSRGWVQLRGSVKRVTGNLIKATYLQDGSQDPVLGTLPQGFWPNSIRRFPVIALGSTLRTAGCKVGSDGSVSLYADGIDVAAIAFDNVRFFADGN